MPRNALYATCVVAGLCFLTSMFGNQSVYLWLLNTSGMTGFIAWLGIAISHYRFRRGYMLQGRDLNDLPYRSGFFPLGPIFAFVLCLIITLARTTGLPARQDRLVRRDRDLHRHSAVPADLVRLQAVARHPRREVQRNGIPEDGREVIFGE